MSNRTAYVLSFTFSYDQDAADTYPTHPDALLPEVLAEELRTAMLGAAWNVLREHLWVPLDGAVTGHGLHLDRDLTERISTPALSSEPF